MRTPTAATTRPRPRARRDSNGHETDPSWQSIPEGVLSRSGKREPILRELPLPSARVRVATPTQAEANPRPATRSHRAIPNRNHDQSLAMDATADGPDQGDIAEKWPPTGRTRPSLLSQGKMLTCLVGRRGLRALGKSSRILDRASPKRGLSITPNGLTAGASSTSALRNLMAPSLGTVPGSAWRRRDPDASPASLPVAPTHDACGMSRRPVANRAQWESSGVSRPPQPARGNVTRGRAGLCPVDPHRVGQA